MAKFVIEKQRPIDQRFLHPTSNKRPPLKHQAQALTWEYQEQLPHIAFLLEMRLGKTLCAIRTVDEIWEILGKCLVVAPVTVLQAWEKELGLEGEKYVVLHGKSAKERVALLRKAMRTEGRVWVLINYEALRRTLPVADADWEVVILDESTAIKNPDSKISRFCCAHFRDVPHRVILSGLPSPEGNMDLYQQFKFLNGEFLGCDNYYEFRAKYGIKVSSYGQYDTNPKYNQLIKAAVHSCSFVMKRTEAGLANRKVKELRLIDLEDEQQEVYNDIEEQFASIRENADGELELMETEFTIVGHTWLARVAGGADIEGVVRWPGKAKELLSLVNGELKGQPIVVWFRFNSEIEYVSQMLSEAGIANRKLMGASSREKRKETFDWFATSKSKTRLLLCQIKLAKYGVDCSVADTAIYYSMTYSCEEISQSEDRIVHPTKKSPLLYLYLLSRDTIDVDVYEAVEEKKYSADYIMQKVRQRRGINTVRKD